jgi:hypothetical protein
LRFGVEVEEIELPKVSSDKKIMQEIGELVALGVSQNVIDQRQADGAPIQENAPSTIAAKRKKYPGRPIRSLIYERLRFVHSPAFKATSTKNETVIEPGSINLRAISKHVQDLGYTGWFGVSAKTMSAIKERLDAYVREFLKKAAKKPKKKKNS